MRALIVLSAASLLVVSSCSGEDTDDASGPTSVASVTEPPPTEPPPTEPPVTEPPPTEPAGLPDQLYGSWQTAGVNTIKFEEDGSRSAVDLAEGPEPFGTGTFTFDGSTLVVATDEGSERCQAGEIGTYEVAFRLTLAEVTLVNDECTGRGRDSSFGMVRIEE